MSMQSCPTEITARRLSDGTEMVFGQPMPPAYAAQYACAIAAGLGDRFRKLSKVERDRQYPVQYGQHAVACGDWYCLLDASMPSEDLDLELEPELNAPETTNTRRITC